MYGRTYSKHSKVRHLKRELRQEVDYLPEDIKRETLTSCTYDYSVKNPEQIREKYSNYSGKRHRSKKAGRAEARILKRILIIERGHRCERCGFEDHVELHHIDDDRTHNWRENAILLCPNCHSLTPSNRRPSAYSTVLEAPYFRQILAEKYGYIYDQFGNAICSPIGNHCTNLDGYNDPNDSGKYKDISAA